MYISLLAENCRRWSVTLYRVGVGATERGSGSRYPSRGIFTPPLNVVKGVHRMETEVWNLTWWLWNTTCTYVSLLAKMQEIVRNLVHKRGRGEDTPARVMINLILFALPRIDIDSSRSVACKKDSSCFFLFLVISPERISLPDSWALYNFLMVWNILIIFGRSKDKGSMTYARETTLTFFIMYLCPLKPKSSAGQNFHSER